MSPDLTRSAQREDFFDISDERIAAHRAIDDACYEESNRRAEGREELVDARSRTTVIVADLPHADFLLVDSPGKLDRST
jgi:hypothetical protein